LPKYDFKVLSGELSIEATEDEVGLGEDVILTVYGNPITYYYLIVTNVNENKPPRIEATGDVKALSGDAVISAQAPDLAAWIKTGSDSIADVKVDTCGADTRTYTIKVYDAPEDAAGTLLTPDDPSGPTWACDWDIVYSEDDDDVDVTVVPATVAFDVPETAVIGEDVEIEGAISAGDIVDIIIKDERVVENDEPVDWNNEFSVEWDTSGYTTGSYTIEGYIDFRPGEAKNLSSYEGVDPDGNTTICLISPGLTVTQPRNFVAEGDDYTFEGTATGVDDVDYILVGPEGWKSGFAIPDILAGILKSAASVTDDEFNEDETMTEGLDPGGWVTLVLAPGVDGEYMTGEPAGALTLAALGVTEGKNQTQILAIIEEVIMGAESDDLMVMHTFEVETPYVRLNPLDNVTIGEPLEIFGTTNREPGTMINISTLEGPTNLSALAEVEWPTPDQGIFNATIDTTNAEPGNYTLRADDGDGNTDTTTVELFAPIFIFDTEAPANPYPSIMGNHKGEIKPSCNINVSRLYTYPCVGTGGHTESIELYENDELIANGTWNGYVGDWHNLTLHNVSGAPYVMLLDEHKYNYTIRTGSYPQIIHARSKDVTGGTITCTSFEDANGKVHYDWIPAIRLWKE
jgi:hypothetical protein